MSEIENVGRNVQALSDSVLEAEKNVTGSRTAVEAASQAMDEFDSHLQGLLAARDRFADAIVDVRSGLGQASEHCKGASEQGDALRQSSNEEAERIVFNLGSLTLLAEGALAQTVAAESSFGEKTSMLPGLTEAVRGAKEWLAGFAPKGDSSLENMLVKGGQIRKDADEYLRKSV